MKVQVEIDLPQEIAEKYDVEYREPKYNEEYWYKGEVFKSGTNFRVPYIVLIPKFNLASWWPKWLTAPWIAMDVDCKWWAYSHEPNILEFDLRFNSNCGGKVRCLSDGLFDFTPPPGFTKDNWRESKLRNPNHTNTTAQVICHRCLEKWTPQAPNEKYCPACRDRGAMNEAQYEATGKAFDAVRGDE